MREGFVFGIADGGVPGPKQKKNPNPPLVATHEELSRLFQLSLDLLCIAGFDGYFKVLNPAWEKVLGHSIEELLSKPWLAFVHPDDIDATIRAGETVMSGAELIRFQNRYRARDGSYR